MIIPFVACKVNKPNMASTWFDELTNRRSAIGHLKIRGRSRNAAAAYSLLLPSLKTKIRSLSVVEGKMLSLNSQLTGF